MKLHSLLNVTSRPAVIYYRWLITGAGFILLFWSSLINRNSLLVWPWYTLIVYLFAIFQTIIPLRLLKSEVYLLHILALGGGILFGATSTAWAISLGVLSGFAIRQHWLKHKVPSLAIPTQEVWLEAGSVMGRQNLALLLALQASGSATGLAGMDTFVPNLPFLSLLLFFAGVDGALFLTDYYLRLPENSVPAKNELVTLVLVEVLPLPFVYIAILSYPSTGVGSIVALGGIPTIVSMLLYGMFTARTALERRLQELSTMHEVSLMLRSTLSLEQQLSIIHQRVSQLLNVDNFYVALYEADKKQVWYPLAVKNGIRQQWKARFLEDRLTDRVIRGQAPILLNLDGDGQNRVDLPPSDVSPTAWIGVPLISSERVIGCLALFSLSPGANFQKNDLDLLVTLSGPVSAGIENALLFQQAQRRAEQLETLNEITRLITASLSPQETFEKVCQSLERVGGGKRSAIYLQDASENQVWLAHAHGLSQHYIEQNTSFSSLDSLRTTCLRTGQPVLVPDVHTNIPEREIRLAWDAEKVIALGDFPLTTPDGNIGFLSVFFDQPHEFDREEVELLQTFASQAAIAVSNSRLHARTDLALSQRVHQLSILESVGRELAAVMNSEQLFEMILHYARDFTNSPWGSLGLYNPRTKRIEIKANAGYTNEWDTYSVDTGISGRAIRTRQAVIVNNVQQDPDYISVTAGMACSQLSVPLIHEERVLGVLTLESAHHNGFSEGDVGFISQLANQAAIAVVNAELYSQTQKRLREQSTLYLISTTLSGQLDVDRVIETIERALYAAFQEFTPGVFLWQENAQNYVLSRVKGSFVQKAHSNHLPAVILADSWKALAQGEPPFEPLCYLAEQRPPSSLVNKCNECQVVLVPIRAGVRNLGLLLLHIPGGVHFNPEEDLQLIRAISAQAALSLQNALLFSDTRQARDRLAAVLNSVREGIILIEGTGRISIANESTRQLTGFLPEQLIDKHLPDLPEPVLRSFGYRPVEAQKIVDSLAKGNLPATSKASIHVTDQRPEKFLERVSLPVWGSDSNLTGWMIILRDVSEEHAVAQARDLITETIVHDLRSPLSAVLSGLDILEENTFRQQPPDEITKQALLVSRRSTGRVLNLVEALLDISRMQSGNMELNLGPTNASDLVATLLIDYIPQANEFGVILRDEVPQDLPAIIIDAGKISRVLINLLDNALKFTPSGGQVIFSAQLNPDGMAQISISDSGPGIPEEYRQKIFERFSQVPGQRSRRRGSGLGLTFCKLAVEAHGGSIWVEPKPGGGSTFKFTVPAVKD